MKIFFLIFLLLTGANFAATVNLNFDSESLDFPSFPERIYLSSISKLNGKFEVEGSYFFSGEEVPFKSRFRAYKKKESLVINIAQENLEGECQMNGFRKISIEVSEDDFSKVRMYGLLYQRDQTCLFNYDSVSIKYTTLQ